MELRLTPEGAAALEEALTQCLSELRSEIHRTDGFEFRKRLKSKEMHLHGILRQLAERGLSHAV